MSSSTATDRPAVLSELHPIFTSLHDAKVKKQLTFEQIAKAINRNEWYTAGLFYGQAKPDADDLKNLAKVMDIRQEYLEQALGSHFFPNRGLGEMPPKGGSLKREKSLEREWPC
jgi:cyanate lyase